MMAQGRGSAKAIALVVILCIININIAESAIYIVGGSNGWTFNALGWTSGKRFRAGDVLVFNYNPSIHNVVTVNAAGYNSCSAPRGAKALTSGKDRIALSKGTNYFICSFPAHCQGNMKIAVTAV